MGHKEIAEMYGNRVRLRVCGLLVKDGGLLMVNHKGLTDENVFWAPPGGGLDFDETLNEALQREFKEETGLEIVVKEFLFVYEFKSEILHAVELFFEVDLVSGIVKTGIDPELKSQIITEVAFKSITEIKAFSENSVHGLFNKCHSLQEVLGLKGYLRD